LECSFKFRVSKAKAFTAEAPFGRLRAGYDAEENKKSNFAAD
jgi:hypothetical protein